MELIKGYLAPFLTILGWGIVLYNADRIALRNESRSSIDGCIKKLEELITLTQEFMHEVDKTSSKKYQYEGKVAALTSSLETKKAYLLKRTHKEFIVADTLVSLRTKLNPNESNDVMEEGIEVAMDLMESLEETFCNRFSAKWYQFVPYWIRITLLVAVWCLIYFSIGGYFIGSPSDR
ncbi:MULTISPECIES: hypothetical protein [Gammaproteobacteria]|uniref:hypothetical protein n=1 Tax=Gammaproteobacteria TaxID=1236 RepID=UPI001183C5E3|nr:MULTISPECIES: hypothetical protein [Gammaproteobacteria]EHU4932342.1 hypothetical protein [Vibrio vulnificus]EIZ1457818.1 hypothetical protein [Vibrio vulnificus]EJE8569839.1 hypothetical protein [Vibrio vulnificus]EKA7349899.1 hypothetical protein [Vibrio vulnificus]ELP6734473.1 hypothetical protein [Vibrio vulnificus]